MNRTSSYLEAVLTKMSRLPFTKKWAVKYIIPEENLLITYHINLHTHAYTHSYLHWASKQTYHFFRAMFTEIHWIKINHIWTQINFNTKHIWKRKQRYAKMWWNCKMPFFKIKESAHCEPPRKVAYSEYSIAIHSISMAGYITAVLAFVWANSKPGKRAVSVTFRTLPLFFYFYFLLKQTFVF